jgi:hypothetical protein
MVETRKTATARKPVCFEQSNIHCGWQLPNEDLLCLDLLRFVRRTFQEWCFRKFRKQISETLLCSSADDKYDIENVPVAFGYDLPKPRHP